MLRLEMMLPADAGAVFSIEKIRPVTNCCELNEEAGETLFKIDTAKLDTYCDPIGAVDGFSALRSENVRLEAYWLEPGIPVDGFNAFSTDRIWLDTHPEVDGFGMLFMFNGSEPKATSRPSCQPSPSVSFDSASVPRVTSSALSSPSLSASAVGFDPGTLIVLKAAGPET